ncbi:hypothetical protein PGB90_004761 [Kerria lacca]
MNIKHALFFIIFVIFIFTQNNYAQLKVPGIYEDVINECNVTYTISKDLLDANNIDTLIESLEQHKNAKCFVFCVLQKLKWVDNNGTVQINNVINAIKTAAKQLPLKEIEEVYTISPDIYPIVESVLSICNNSTAVIQQIDPCEKIFQFIVCIKDASEKESSSPSA